jgi:hypothetical protein
MKKKDKCICLICYVPNEFWLDFFSRFVEYDIYIVIDNNSINFKKLYCDEKYKNINFIQIDNKLCEDNGFKNTNNYVFGTVNGWDKVLLFSMSLFMNTYNNVWIMEDDVFLFDEKTLINIDKKYEDADLLSADLEENNTGEKETWHWPTIEINLNPPFYHGMMCCVRMSRKLLNSIKEYCIVNKTLFFLEALFPTIAKNNNLICSQPEELKNIFFRHNFDIMKLNTGYIYHPIKDLNIQNIYRRIYNFV